MCAGIEGKRPEEAPLAALRTLGPGGVVLFARNVGTAAELRSLTAALASALDDGSPAFVAVDQEGGRVARIRDGVVALPSAMAFGAAGDPEATRRAAERLAGDLRGLGVTVDFAPCADLSLDPDGTVIGNRSYGDDPERVAAHVAAFAGGLVAGGVAACVKHAPGHGATAGDSHVELPQIAADPERLAARDLVPFRAALAAGARLVMTAHVVVPALDAVRPATLSPAVVRFIRERLNFRGVLVTDCLTMAAVSHTRGVPAAAVEALAAGADMLVISRDLAAVHAARDAIVAAVREGRMSLERLEEAAMRVRTARDAMPLASLPFAADDSVGFEVARRAVTLVRGDARLVKDVPVSVVSFEGELGDGASDAHVQLSSLSARLRARRWKSEHLRVPLEPDAGDLELLLAVLAGQAERNIVIVMRRARRYPSQLRAVRALLERFPSAKLVSAREPYDLAEFPSAADAIAIYGDEEVSFDGLADAMSGRFTAAGRLPVALGSSAIP